MGRGTFVSGQPEDEYEESGSHLDIPEWGNMANSILEDPFASS